MIELKPVNIKRFEVVKSSYIETMTNYFLGITHKPQHVVEEFFTRGVNKIINRKWELRNHHFREIYLQPEKKKIGLLWYRTHVEEIFSDVAVLQWVGTEVESDLRKYAKEIIDVLCAELKNMEISRLAVESYASNDALDGMWEDMGFAPVRIVMNKQIQ